MKTRIFIAFCLFTNISCTHLEEEFATNLLQTVPSKDLIKQNILDLSKNIKPVTNYKSVVEDCEIEVEPGCIQWSEVVSFYLDISGCSTSETDSCWVTGEMLITFCDLGNGNYVANFEESYWGHDVNCILNVNTHMDDFVCLGDLIYEAYVNFMMPIILETLIPSGDCENGNLTILSNYVKQLCVIPCGQIDRGGYRITTVIPCGASEACCIETSRWCETEEGIIQSTPLTPVRYGQCSPSDNPCTTSFLDDIGEITTCNPRGCEDPGS